MTTTRTIIYAVCNLAGGDHRVFRSDRDGSPSGASIRHARRIRRMTGMDAHVSHPEIAEQVFAILAGEG